MNSTKPRFSIFDELDKGLNHFVNEVLQHDRNRSSVPPLAVYEFDNRYLVECDVPGVKLEDVSLTIDDGTLELTAERRHAVAEEEKCTVDERQFGQFQRRLKLGKDVDTESVDAELKDGVLRITIPKSESVLPRKISIRKPESDQP